MTHDTWARVRACVAKSGTWHVTREHMPHESCPLAFMPPCTPLPCLQEVHHAKSPPRSPNLRPLRSPGLPPPPSASQGGLAQPGLGLGWKSQAPSPTLPSIPHSTPALPQMHTQVRAAQLGGRAPVRLPSGGSPVRGARSKWWQAS